MLEFALLLPIALFVVLLLLQVTLLMVGRVFTQYAATAATRTAIVQLPRDLADRGHGGPNWIVASEGNVKHDAIHAAASHALLPVAGRVSGSGGDGARYAQAMADYLTRAGGDVPAWVDNLLADRYRYAFANTAVDLLIVEQADADSTPTFDLLPAGWPHQFGPRDAVTVRVRHRLNLSIPYVKAIFADGETGDGRDRNHYTTVSARSTLTNKGDTRDLPPPPALPRRERD